MHVPSNHEKQNIVRRLHVVDVSPVSLTLCVTAILMLGYNATYWSRGLDIFSGHLGKLLLFNLAVYGLTLAAFAFFSFRPMVKPFLAFMLVLSAVTSYYMDTLGVMIDRDMVQNVATTTFTESKHLLTADFVSHVAIFGVLPALLLLPLRVRRQRWRVALGAPMALFAISLLLASGLLMLNLKTYASVLRERKEFIGSYQPGAPLVGAIRYARMMARSGNITVRPIGEDAIKGDAYAGARKSVLTIIVAGETARTQNFSLDGYARLTNPELSEREVISFTDVSSCGTATAVSLPCMFSNYTRDDYSFEKGASTETLLDVLAHAGFAVEWWDNNTGDKGIAARVPKRFFTKTDSAEFCSSGECNDGIFLEQLQAYVSSITKDTVLVFHQIGSHGPTYHLRYPPGYGTFQPACNTAEFKNCTPDEIVNAYDNTILYTDHVLSQTIDFLDAQDGLTTSLLYVSDHGESLGEAGLYLHGTPYFMAPETQTKVPMILWMSEGFAAQLDLSKDCLTGKTRAALSQDNLFHSVLGMLDIKTGARDAKLDIFADCRSIKEMVRK
jgi:lipid A ethanolaminephosphotransferase